MNHNVPPEEKVVDWKLTDSSMLKDVRWRRWGSAMPCCRRRRRVPEPLDNAALAGLFDIVGTLHTSRRSVEEDMEIVYGIAVITHLTYIGQTADYVERKKERKNERERRVKCTRKEIPSNLS